MPLPKTPRAVGWSNTAILAWLRERAVASGVDPKTIPDEPFAIWRPAQVIARTGLGRTSIWRAVRDSQFPKPIVLRDIGARVQ
jgi:predicted DNA-binding transcriptional regulator AlpA